MKNPSNPSCLNVDPRRKLSCTRAALAGARGSTLLSALATTLGLISCAPEPIAGIQDSHHAEVLDVSTLQKPLTFTGVASNPGAEITLEVFVLDTPESSADLDIDAFWEPVATTRASEAQAPNPHPLQYQPGTGIRLTTPPPTYPFTLTSAPATWPETAALEAGGLLYFRLLEAGNPLLELPDLPGQAQAATASEECTQEDANAETPCSPYFILAADSLTPPSAQEEFLSRRSDPSTATNQETRAYYEAIEAGSTDLRFSLQGWKVANGFPSEELRAYYYNVSDLGFGREMVCRQVEETQGVACYVTNYGQPGGNAAQSINQALEGHNPVATVAMEYVPASPDNPALANPVRFFAYDGAGALLTQVQLDSQGPKSTPQVCLSCHGGQYDAEQHRVVGASFLPFDPQALLFASEEKAALEPQQEVLRRLNALVKSTAPAAGIDALIQTLYDGNVEVEGAPFVPDNVPDGWLEHSRLYLNVVAPYCRGCHNSLESSLAFQTSEAFFAYQAAIVEDVCGSRVMPHAEQTSLRFWKSGARAELLRALNVYDRCTPR